MILSPYDPAWSRKAELLADEIGALGSGVLAVHHVGSTSVPGLMAKPVIDLLAVVESLVWLDGKRTQLEAMGYEWRGEYGIAGRRYCVLHGGQSERVAHLHCYELLSPHIARHLAFRDYLRAHPDKQAEYAEVKRKAWDDSSGQKANYAAAKSSWVARIEREAMDWFCALSQSPLE